MLEAPIVKSYHVFYLNESEEDKCETFELQYVITTRFISSLSTVPDRGLRFIWPIDGVVLWLCWIPGVPNAPNYQ